jgi:hypothetical protein
MSTEEELVDLRSIIEKLTNDGVAVIRTSALADLLPITSDRESEARYQARLNAWLLDQREYHNLTADSLKARHELFLEGLRATLTFGTSTLRATTIMNGGAELAILAYIGNAATLASQLGRPESVPRVREIIELRDALITFASGVFLAAAATGASYLSQGSFTDAGDINDAHAKRGYFWRKIVIALTIGSFLTFLVGLALGYCGLGRA